MMEQVVVSDFVRGRLLGEGAQGKVYLGVYQGQKYAHAPPPLAAPPPIVGLTRVPPASHSLPTRSPSMITVTYSWRTWNVAYFCTEVDHDDSLTNTCARFGRQGGGKGADGKELKAAPNGAQKRITHSVLVCLISSNDADGLKCSLDHPYCQYLVGAKTTFEDGGPLILTEVSIHPTFISDSPDARPCCRMAENPGVSGQGIGASIMSCDGIHSNVEALRRRVPGRCAMRGRYSTCMRNGRSSSTRRPRSGSRRNARWASTRCTTSATCTATSRA
eukprot:3035852-Rhodomonas_salina.2